MQIQEVNNSKSKKAFLDVARLLYKNDDVWVCPMDQDIINVFDPNHNIYFTHGTAIRWILKDDQGYLIGRIAAFINEKKADFDGKRGGGIGFFECINDNDAAFKLFDIAKEWLVERKVNYILGPINFGENDFFWGLLVKGFTHPSYGMNYNHPYYEQLFLDYGFTVKVQQLTNSLNVKEGLDPRFVKVANYVLKKKKSITLRHLDEKHFDELADDFIEIYNKAWTGHENFTPIKKEYIRDTFIKIKPIYEQKFIWFAYVDGNPAGFVFCLPDVNQIFKHFNGKINLWNKLRFLILKRRKVINRIRVIALGTSPEYQNMGLESVMTAKCFERALEAGHYTDGELSWVGDFNDKMLAIHKGLGAVLDKVHITYELHL
jgi:GNAT superfamily N-acetyltransferase